MQASEDITAQYIPLHLVTALPTGPMVPAQTPLPPEEMHTAYPTAPSATADSATPRATPAPSPEPSAETTPDARTAKPVSAQTVKPTAAKTPAPTATPGRAGLYSDNVPIRINSSSSLPFYYSAADREPVLKMIQGGAECRDGFFSVRCKLLRQNDPSDVLWLGIEFSDSNSNSQSIALNPGQSLRIVNSATGATVFSLTVEERTP